MAAGSATEQDDPEYPWSMSDGDEEVGPEVTEEHVNSATEEVGPEVTEEHVNVPESGASGSTAEQQQLPDTMSPPTITI